MTTPPTSNDAEQTNKGPKPLGEYLACSSDIIESALREQASEGGDHPKRLGEILTRSNKISPALLEAALQAQRMDRLRACTLFSKLKHDELARIGRGSEELSISAGQDIIAQETRDPYLYVIASGRLLVYRRDEFGEESPLAFLEPGEPLGEMGYFSDGIRSASVRALEDVQLLRLHYSQIDHWLELIPNFARAYLKVVTKRLRATNLTYQEDFGRRKTAERSLKYLNEFLDLSAGEGLEEGIEGLICHIVHTATSLMDAERGSLFLIDPLTGELWSKVAEGAEVREIRIPAGAGVAGYVAQHKQTVNIKDAYQDPRFNPETDIKTGYHTNTILCGPVWNLKHEVIGVIQAINKKGGAFNQQDEMMFQAFGHQAAVAVENFNLYRRVVANNETIAILLDIAYALNQTLDIGELIHKIVTKMCAALRCERSAFFVLDRDQNELWSMDAHGSELTEIRFPANIGLAGHCATTGEPLNIVDAHQDERFNPEVDRKTGYHTRSVLCVPVLNNQGKVTGVCQAINKIGELFHQDDVELLRAISSHIAVALENAQLYARTIETRNYLERVQESIANGIVTLDNHYQLVTTNQSAARLFEMLELDSSTRDIRQILGPKNAHLCNLIEQAYHHAGGIIEYDVELEGAQERHIVNVNILSLMDAEEKRQGLVMALDDITREKRIKSTLTRYMANDIVDRMLNDPSQQMLGGVCGEATILFNDIRNFTTLSEQLSAEEVMDFLNEYFTLMVEEVFNSKGLLDKFIGDAMMAVFGVPYAREDDAIRAVETALNMKQRLTEFNHQRMSNNQPPISIGIGINTDEVVSGNMGSEKRMDYTVIGDGVNVSSRLEALTKRYGTDILISGSTQARLNGKFRLRAIDRIILHGKTRSVEIYEVMGRSDYQPTAPQQAFESGYQAYRQRNFEGALQHFLTGAEEDKPCRIFAQRCETLIAAAPPDDWDGAWVMEQK